MIDIDELLTLSVHEASDHMLAELCRRGKRCCRVTMPGRDESGAKVTVTLEVKYDS